jgi:PAS domain S-box-containing protein
MNIEAIPYALPLFVSGVIPVVLIYYITRSDFTSTKKLFAFLLGTVSFWSFCYAMELLSGDVATLTFWHKMTYIGIVLTPVAWLLFAFEYTGRIKWVNSKYITFLLFLPLVHIILLWTNDFHHLFWESVQVKTSNDLLALFTTSGPFFWSHTLYSYILILFGMFLFSLFLIRFHTFYRRQAFLLFVGVLSPFIGNIFIVSGLLTLPLDYDVTPLLFMITGITFTLGIFRCRFLYVSPVARHTIFDKITDAIFVINNDKRIVDFNVSATRIVKEYIPQFSAETIIGKDIATVFSGFPEIIRFFTLGDETLAEMNLGDSKDKKILNIQLVPLDDPQEDFSGWILLLKDITSLKRTEQMLVESEEMYRAFIDSTDDMAFLKDDQLRYVIVNRANADFFGKPEKDIIGKTDFDLMPGTSAKGCSQSDHQALTSDTAVVSEETVDNRIYETKKFRIRLKSGRYGVGGFIRDITKQRMLINELQDAHQLLYTINRELERKVKDRTAEVEKLLHQKDEFVNQLGHDLKTPLTPIIALIPVINDYLDDPKVQELFKVVRRNANYMKDLVNQTIELAKLNSSHVEFNFEEVHLNTLIDEVISNNYYMLSEQHITASNNVHDLYYVHGDHLRLGEVFTNLLTNAMKYMKKEGGEITIDATQDTTKVTVSVRDSGIGMTPDQLSHIFEEFYKADQSRHDLHSAGLGLTICERIIKKHGGDIWVESPGPGKGSTFYFTLPLEQPQKPEESELHITLN